MNTLKLLLVSISFWGITTLKSQEISMQSLLRDLVNREQLTEFPKNPFYCLQASSYNRASISPDQPGWFADSDGVHCIRTEVNKKGDTEWVLMEDFGPGAITKIWAVCFYYSLDDTTGANINIYLDGSEEPTIRCNFFDFVRGQAFVKAPLASETRRAGNSYLPIPYSKSCKVTMDNKVFYNIINYQHYPEGTSVKTFSMHDFYNSFYLLDSVNNILEQGTASPSNSKIIHTKKELIVLKTRETKSISFSTPFEKGAAIQQFSIKFDSANLPQALRSTIFNVSFDGESCIWSPIGDFFNIGVGIKPYSMWERSVRSDGTMSCRWIMPFKDNSTFTLENLGEQEVKFEISIEYTQYNWAQNSMYFHSSWRMDEPVPGFPLFDYNFLKVNGKGVYVGDQFTVLNPEEGWWGEGDEKVYVDNDNFPSHFGTGTEDYYGWAGGVVPTPADEFSHPFLGNIRVGSPNSIGYNTCTRTRVLDAIPFNRKIDFNIESSGSNRTSWFHLQYAINTYWYACPGAISNQGALPEMVARKIPTLEYLQSYNERMKLKLYSFPKAIEAENIINYEIDPGVEIPNTVSLWGELSNGEAKSFTCTKIEQCIQVSITEIFKTKQLRVCLIINNKGGEFDIFINKKFICSVNLWSEHSAVSTINLGENEPSDNKLNIKFVCRQKGNLSIDYFLVD